MVTGRASLCSICAVAWMTWGCGSGPGGGDAAVGDAEADVGPRPDATADSGGADSGTLDAGGGVPVVFELVNTGSDNAFLDGSFNRDCEAPYFRALREGSPVVDRLPFLACDCASCGSTGCSGLADSGPAFVEIPPGGVARVRWPGLLYEPSGGCDRGCMLGSPAGDGSFTAVVDYRRGSLECPLGDTPLPSELPGPEGDASTFVCQTGGVRCFRRDTTAFDRQVEAAFSPSDGTVRIELP